VVVHVPYVMIFGFKKTILEHFHVHRRLRFGSWLRARSRSPRTLYLNSRMVTPMSEHMGYDTFLKGNCT
jgi:hypothetical protein